METLKIPSKNTLRMNIRTTPFETLYRLEGYLTARQEMLRYATVGISFIALSGPVWFCVAVILGLAGAVHTAMIFVLMMPGAFLLAFLLWLCLYALLFPDVERNRHLLQGIRHELQRRGQRAFTFVCDN